MLRTTELIVPVGAATAESGRIRCRMHSALLELTQIQYRGFQSSELGIRVVAACDFVKFLGTPAHPNGSQ